MHRCAQGGRGAGAFLGTSVACYDTQTEKHGATGLSVSANSLLGKYLIFQTVEEEV